MPCLGSDASQHPQVWGQKSSGAVPFGTLFALFFLWFGISTPLVFVGSYFGYKKPAPEDPVRTNKIPRQIPDQVHAAAMLVPAGGLSLAAHAALVMAWGLLSPELAACSVALLARSRLPACMCTPCMSALSPSGAVPAARRRPGT